MYKVCIFDLDGTLADTVESMSYSANLALKELGLPQQPSEKFKTFAGDGAQELCRRCLVAAGDEVYKNYDYMYALYKKYFAENCLYHVKVYDGILELLEFLKTNGQKIAVLSNKPHKQAVEVVETIFEQNFFDLIYGNSDSRPRKPDPSGVIQIAEHFAVSKEECLYIGDTGTDMLTGKRAEIKTMGVLWGFRTKEELKKNGADFIVTHPSEVRKWIEEQNAQQQIKLIASDIDGTLLQEGSANLNPELFQVIKQLKSKGIIFAAASGRQYRSIKALFEPAAEDMIFIADNGANVICKGRETYASVMDPGVVKEVIEEIRQLKDCYLVVSSRSGETYMEQYHEELFDLLVNGYHNTLHHVADILAEPIDIIKCSIYKKHGILDLAPGFMEKYHDRLHVTIAGEIWLDFMDLEADKGKALQKIQHLMHIKKEETMVFGDNMNDIGMIRAAGESYAVSNAVEQVKKEAKYIAGKNTEDGVLNVLKTLL